MHEKNETFTANRRSLVYYTICNAKTHLCSRTHSRECNARREHYLSVISDLLVTSKSYLLVADTRCNGVSTEFHETMTRPDGGGMEGRLSSAGRKRRQLNISWEAENWIAGGRAGRGVLRAVIYEVSKTLYTPTRQRAGLAPRNPVLALTHRYLSHDHFWLIRAHAHGETYVRLHGTSFGLLHAGVFTIYSAPRVGNAVEYLVDIVYLGYSPPHDSRDFSSRRKRLSLARRSSSPVRKRHRNDCLAPDLLFLGDKWSGGTYRH